MKKIIKGVSVLFLVFGALYGIQSCKNKNENSKSDYQSVTDFVFKEKLSDYGFFIGKLKDLKSNKGILSYKLNSALFTDYALKDRFIVVPKGTKMKYTSHGVLDFPDGTILIKNFAYTNTDHQKIMIETRLLAKNPKDKKWYVMNYLWNKEQTDAVKHISGANIPITLLDEENNTVSTTYKVPNTNDCKRCHVNQAVLTPIGPKAMNLNNVILGVNQLEKWADSGYLQGLPEIGKVPVLPNWEDVAKYDLNQRARAYLDINCAHCHTKGGDAFNTGLFLEYGQNEKSVVGIMKEPVSAGGGADGLNFDIVPGNAYESILYNRMNSTVPGTAMPELGRSLKHKAGIKLIHDWIQSMKK